MRVDHANILVDIRVAVPASEHCVMNTEPEQPNVDREKLDIERKKLDVEREKLEVEREKLALEKKKAFWLSSVSGFRFVSLW